MANSLNDSLIGQLVDGRYLVRERVGRGGMATVYRAVDKRLGRTVALKVMHPHLAEGTSGQNFVARFRREARAAARVTHPGLVAVYDQGVDGDISYLTLEFVEGSDLRRLLDSKGTLTLGESLAIAEDILDALAAAHRNQLVHRDVKPENVLLSDHNEVKITDFGLARAVTEVTSTTTGTILGTVAYLAPELVTTGVGATQTDVYAVGIMLYEMVTGRQPFTGDTPINLAFQHVNSPMPRITERAPWVPGEVEDLILTFTEKTIEARPQHAGEALRLLRDVVSHLKPATLAKRLDVAPSNATSAKNTSAEQSADLVGAHSSLASLDTDGGLPLSADTTTFDMDDAVLMENRESTPVPTATEEKVDLDDELVALFNATSQHVTVPLSVRHSGSTIAIPLGNPDTSGEQETTTRQDSADPTRSNRKRTLLVSLLVLLVAGGASYGGWFWWTNIGPGAYTSVPARIIALPQDEALAVFETEPLDTQIREEYSDDVPEGLIIDLEPQSGERIKKNSTVTLTVSLGIQEFEVPKKLTGKTYQTVSETLSEAGFSRVSVNRLYDTKVKKDTVMQLSVKEGATLPHNTDIVLTVSDGPEPITVPQVINKTQNEAQTILDEYEMNVKVKQDFSLTVEKGLVVSQDPAQGSRGHRGDKITIVVSKGPELVTVPDVTGKKTEEATKILEDLGFEVKTNLYLDGFFGLVRFQDVKGGEQVPKGSKISLTVF